jgi:hypothetical protein
MSMCLLLGDENVLKLDSGDVTQHYDYIKSHWIVHLKIDKMVGLEVWLKP